MVVVNGASDLVGQEVGAEVQSTIQTGSGLMVFAGLKPRDTGDGSASRG